MKKFTITENDAGQRFDRFITKVCPAMPTSLMFKFIRTKKIKLNGKRAEINTRLSSGDEVTAYINDEFFVSPDPKYSFLTASTVLDIVYEDDNILLADKKQGVLVHPDKNQYTDTLIDRIQRYLFEKGEYDPSKENSFSPSLANRIDRNTGGIVIAAKNAESLRILCEKIKNREIEKRYLAVAHGTPEKATGKIESFLEKNEDKNQVFIKRQMSEKSKTAITKYRVIDSKNGLSLVELELLTGRTHQIRAQMVSIGHPLLGDGKYGKTAEDKRKGFNKQALYSYSLKFDFKTDAGILNYLNGKKFTVNDVWFANELFGDGYKSLLK